jgi:hypothetical protein
MEMELSNIFIVKMMANKARTKVQSSIAALLKMESFMEKANYL